MFPMKIISLVLTLIQFRHYECQSDYCSMIITNYNYPDIGIYYRFLDKNKGQYFVYNGQGYEWEFKMIEFENVLQIVMFGNKPVHNVELIGVKRRFSLLDKKKKTGSQYTTFGTDCTVTAQKNSSVYLSKCQNLNESSEISTTDQFNDKTLFLIPSPLKDFPNKVYIMSLDDKRVGRKFEIKNNEFKFLATTGDSNKVPESFNQISQPFYENLNGIVHYINESKTGYLLLFNIEGKPRYCFTPEDVLSDECKSIEKMRILFEECYPRSYPQTTTSLPETETSSEPHNKPVMGRNFRKNSQPTITTESGDEDIIENSTPKRTTIRSITTKSRSNKTTKSALKSESESNSSNIAIIAIIIFVLIAIALIAFIGLFLYVRSNKKGQKTLKRENLNNQFKKNFSEPKKGKFGDLDSNLDLAVVVNTMSKESLAVENPASSKVTNTGSKTKTKK